MKARFVPSIIARQIGIPVEDWPGHCYCIAMAMWRHPRIKLMGAVHYGKWLGEIAPGSFYDDEKKAMAGHAWIEEVDGTIIDPTRYVFEGVRPYIYVGSCDLYGEIKKTHPPNFLEETRRSIFDVDPTKPCLQCTAKQRGWTEAIHLPCLPSIKG
jgi:hypothetical protein